ncbi:unnamed protein product, partial [Sphacelaria rigidula]
MSFLPAKIWDLCRRIFCVLKSSRVEEFDLAYMGSPENDHALYVAGFNRIKETVYQRIPRSSETETTSKNETSVSGAVQPCDDEVLVLWESKTLQFIWGMTQHSWRILFFMATKNW